MRSYYTILLITILTFQACGYTKPVKVDFSPATTPAAPDYSSADNWCALPEIQDSADHVPAIGIDNNQILAVADVFFVHPTSFFSRKEWNGALDDEKLNRHTDEGSIYHQASVFNGSCRVYAPRYRQVPFQAFFSLDNPDADAAFALAYEDVRNAFLYYMEHYNNGRPVIIAAHSQGTIHAIGLLQEFFDQPETHVDLIAAYLTGMPVYDTTFQLIPPCASGEQLDCYVSWRSWLRGHYPKKEFLVAYREQVVVVNTLSWTLDTALVDASHNYGGLGRTGKKIYPRVCNAQIHEDLLWVSKPDIPGKALLLSKNYHRADYNLYWLNIRLNVAVRVNKWQEANH